MAEPDEHYYVEGYSVEDDPYVEPNGVLKNHFGITSTADLLLVEDEIVTIVTAGLDENPVVGNFDLLHLQDIHRRLFGEVYPWAGELRRVDIGKAETRFLANGLIERCAEELFAGLAQENFLQGLDDMAFCPRVAEYFGRLNFIHPFREGNGRTQREFFRLIAHQAGYEIDWSGCSQGAMIGACIAALAYDFSRLTRLIRVGLQPYAA